MAEPPLRDDELRVLRGMMDEYKTGELRHRMLAEFFSDGRKVVVIVGGLLMWLVMMLSGVLIIIHGGHN